MSEKTETKTCVDKTVQAPRGASSVNAHKKATSANDRPEFDREVDHLPKSVVERQVERLIRKNKQALDELAKL